ncbi:hypothetical protein L227DRAFT_562364 [Lentinus tigrinus ALCF2SS1-6]|uniref:Uncharacterized protein n=1 Tax=Lentinus tigrinus ALCF2SS1-6 TaxID=1328759 RepID=A0A5C2SFI9_9APHY|nr:hypothetical protein L227DRAFT_562364 [Lentinus tigrinus ALCF2SS1-6]
MKNGFLGYHDSVTMGTIWWKDPGFFSGGIAQPVLTRTAPLVARDLSPSPPPFVPPEGEWTESPSLTPSPELLSPPQTACSTIAVLGSAGLNRSFEDDYDRPEASPNFIRGYLRRSRSLRRQARMRDGDFRDTDDEHDYSVTTETIPAITYNVNTLDYGRASSSPRTPSTSQSPSVDSLSSADSESDGLSTRAASRLSQRVRPPPPINTNKKTLRNGQSYHASRVAYEVESDLPNDTLVSLPSDSGFDADDEDDSPVMLPVRVGRKAADGGSHATADSRPDLGMPGKKTYAAVVASSPPRVSRPASRSALDVGAHAILPEWRPFVEPLDA